jgi:hypothetical protein
VQLSEGIYEAYYHLETHHKLLMHFHHTVVPPSSLSSSKIHASNMSLFSHWCLETNTREEMQYENVKQFGQWVQNNSINIYHLPSGPRLLFLYENLHKQQYKHQIEWETAVPI